MPRVQSAERKKAREIYEEHNGQITNREIANILGISEKTVSGWKCKDNWTGNKRSTPNENKRSTPKRKRGGQPGNHNATGPPGNRHAEKHGFFTKWLPEETKEILGEIDGDDPLDILWVNIKFQYAAIIRAQKLMYVKDQNDKTKEKIEYKDGNVIGEKWEVQQAWDKHATFMNAQSRSVATLLRMIREYDEMLHKNWDDVTEEQKARIAQLKSKVPNTDVTNFNEQIQSIAELINNPVPERNLNDDTVCTADEEAE